MTREEQIAKLIIWWGDKPRFGYGDGATFTPYPWDHILDSTTHGWEFKMSYGLPIT